jgi:multicomponent Na+:H+ antiporter subunit B
MTLIVKMITRLVTGFIMIFGLYIVIYGHITPGGGFAGGVILALSLILVLMAFGKNFVDELISQEELKAADVAGALAFLVIALLGYVGTRAVPEGMFFLNFIPRGTPFELISGGFIPLCNVAIGVKVGACLFGVLVALSVFHSRHHAPLGSKEE